jgi:Flp pilus assembly protein protease CpaA
MAIPFTIGLLALLLIAAWRDVATRAIPDTVALLVVTLGLLARALEGPLALALSLGTALLLFYYFRSCIRAGCWVVAM